MPAKDGTILFCDVHGNDEELCKNFNRQKCLGFKPETDPCDFPIEPHLYAVAVVAAGTSGTSGTGTPPGPTFAGSFPAIMLSNGFQ
jgi:hypothetical protein